jgi:hypothetical protein
MSYRCTICFQTVPASVPCNKRVTRTRVKHYREREYAKREWRYVRDRWKWIWIPDPGGIGFETVKEANCCPRCASELDNEHRATNG